MIIDKLQIINEALGRVGSTPLFALNEDSDKARSCALMYDTEIDALFGETHWNFAQRTVRLDQADEEPINGWRYAYALPGERVGLPVRVLSNPRQPDHPLRRYAVEGDRIYADMEPLHAAFVMRVDPQNWLPVFKRAAVMALAAALAVPISEDRTKGEEYRTIAFGNPSEGGRGGLIGRAIAEDMRGSPGPAPAYASDPFTDAFTGG